MADARPLDIQLRLAIAQKRLIEVRYNGRLRVAEPHDYGIQNGSRKLLVYQLRTRGGGPGGETRGWRLLDVAKITICGVCEATFAGSRTDAAQRHFTWDELFARVT